MLISKFLNDHCPSILDEVWLVKTRLAPVSSPWITDCSHFFAFQKSWALVEISSFTHSPFLFEGSFSSFNTSVRDVMPPTFQNWFQRAKLILRCYLTLLVITWLLLYLLSQLKKIKTVNIFLLYFLKKSVMWKYFSLDIYLYAFRPSSVCHLKRVLPLSLLELTQVVSLLNESVLLLSWHFAYIYILLVTKIHQRSKTAEQLKSDIRQEWDITFTKVQQLFSLVPTHL